MTEEIQRTLGRLETKVDMGNQKLDVALEVQKEHGQRLANMERTRSWFRGAVAALMALGGFAIASITGIFKP